MIRLILALALLQSPIAAAAVADLHEIQFPDRKTVPVSMVPLPGAPLASLDTRVTFRDGSSRIEIEHQGLKPAILFGGDVTCWVIWAVSADGSAENLGEIGWGPKGKEAFDTARSRFALLVTAESGALPARPSGLIGFANRATDAASAASRSFRLEALAPAPAHVRDDINTLAWDPSTSLAVAQARRAFEVAGALDAGQHAPDLYAEAKQAVEQAVALEKGKGGDREMQDAARRGFQLSSAAIRRSTAARESIRAADELAGWKSKAAESQKLAETSAASAASAEARGTELSQQVTVLQEQNERMREELADLSGSKSMLEDERAELRNRLKGALSQVAETQDSVRGFVVSLPDILFDTNQATLKPDTEVVIAKLAGILLVVTDLRVRVEGYTDSTGTLEHNMQLSQARADSVVAFMTEQGVPADRMEAVGLGPEHPIGDNDTREGRSRNRRVEIVLSTPDQS